MSTTRRVGWGGQAQIMGYYDKKYAFGIVTTFRKTPKPNLDKFKTLMDTQFKTVAKLLLNGYDIIRLDFSMIRLNFCMITKSQGK